MLFWMFGDLVEKIKQEQWPAVVPDKLMVSGDLEALGDARLGVWCSGSVPKTTVGMWP